MVIFTWIVLGIAGLLLAASGACWGLFVTLDQADWRTLAVKLFRIGVVFVLFYINVTIYRHIFGVVAGVEKPVPAVLSDEV